MFLFHYYSSPRFWSAPHRYNDCPQSKHRRRRLYLRCENRWLFEPNEAECHPLFSFGVSFQAGLAPRIAIPQRSVIWTATARRDVNAIWDYIEARNPDAAELVSSEILRAVEELLQFPKRSKPVRVKETRELVVLGLPYVVVYLLVDGKVVILRVLHGAQNWPI